MKMTMRQEILNIRKKEIIQNVYGFENFHGTKTKVLREIAKKIAKEKDYGYLNEKHESFEEIMIHAFVIGYMKEDVAFILKCVDKFIPMINSWASNDALCQGLKIAKKYQKEFFDYIEKFKDSENEWERRIIMVMLLSHYNNQEYIDKALKLIDYVKKDSYMVKMGAAWALATFAIKFPIKTLGFLKRNTLDVWTHNKAISKINESFRVDENTKSKAKMLRRK